MTKIELNESGDRYAGYRVGADVDNLIDEIDSLVSLVERMKDALVFCREFNYRDYSRKHEASIPDLVEEAEAKIKELNG